MQKYAGIESLKPDIYIYHMRFNTRVCILLQVSGIRHGLYVIRILLDNHGGYTIAWSNFFEKFHETSLETLWNIKNGKLNWISIW